MRKHIISRSTKRIEASDQPWLDVEHLARVEVTSEDPAYPIEAALLSGKGSGWRAAEAGQQMLQLLFDQPQRVRRVRLAFQEHKYERTQEFVLSWSAGSGQADREIVRQQYHFSPPGTTTELEEYTVDLEDMTALRLNIVPDINTGVARASLSELRLA